LNYIELCDSVGLDYLWQKYGFSANEGDAKLSLLKSKKLAIISTFVYVIAYYLWIILNQGNKRSLIVGANIFQTMAPIIGCILLFITYKKIEASEKSFWLFMGLGTLCYALNMLVWDYYEIILQRPNTFYLGTILCFSLMYLFYLIAILGKIYKGRSFYKGFHSVLDALIVMSALVTISYNFVISPVLQYSYKNSLGLALTFICSPVLDLILLFGVLYLYFTSAEVLYYKVYMLLSWGMFMLSLADSGYLYLLLKGTYRTGSFYDPLWSFGYIAVGIAGIYALHIKQSNVQNAKISSKMSIFNTSSPYILVMIFIAVELIYSHGSITAGMVITSMLVIIKQFLVIIDNKNLLQDISVLNYELEDKVKRRTRELEESQQRYKSLFEQNSSAVYSLDLEGKITSINSACEKLIGYPSEEILDTSVFDLLDKEGKEISLSYFSRVVDEGSQTFEIPFTTKDKTKLELEVTGVPIKVDNVVIGMYGIIKDITENKKSRQKIHHMAFHDSLTGLPNRRLFQNTLEQLLADLKNTSLKAAVMYIDLDRFKGINDTLGHEMGDQLLVAVSNRLKNCLRNTDLIARQGGDEFTVLLPNLISKSDAATVAEKIINALNEAFLINEQELAVSGSIGIAIFPEDGKDSVTLMKNADAAMYRVKDEGKNGYQLYTSEINEIAAKKFTLEKNLKQALKQNELLLYYQPQVDVRSNKIIGAEALVRWKHPKLGLISPGEFIPLAEETGLILPMSEWILKTACSQMKLWLNKGYELPKIGVNISPKQFQLNNFIETISGILKDTGLKGEYLDFEITESIAMQKENEVISKILELRRMGSTVSIDDFGTGYSSLSYLKKFPITTLKIAQQFVSEIQSDSDEEAIVSAIIAMAKNLNLNIIAEGVETEAHVKFLGNQNCHIMQGYFFNRPMPAEEFEEILRKS
jgi:diguanylate cyclase (GGDEF)-like protein/PAS domain S-box-containing protein